MQAQLQPYNLVLYKRIFLVDNCANGCENTVLQIVPFLVRSLMPQVTLNTLAPDFTLQNFQGETLRLSDFRGQSHILLVFNRGFI